MWRKVSAGAAIVVAAAAVAIVYAFDPASAGFFPACPFHLLTGLQCPGCGATRALHHLLHGDVAGAFRLNALLMLASPMLSCGVYIELRAHLGGTQRPAVIYRPWFAWTVAAVIAAWSVIRNVAGL